MSERKTNDGEIEQIVRSHLYPSNEVNLRKVTKTWSPAGLLYAIDRLESDLFAQPKEILDRLRVLYRTLLKDHEEAEARQASEVADAKRHDEISRRLEELKKPHWSIVPNFWMTLVILVLTAVAAVASVLALRH
jgi:hypothetical protein